MKTAAFLLCLLLPLSAGSTRPPSTAPDVFMEAGGLQISREGHQLILNHEVDGGVLYYDKALKRPCWPGGASGVTVGIGYDLGYNTRARIAADWARLDPSVIRRLQACAGVTGLNAKRLLPGVRSLIIPWDIALEVYHKKTIPRFAALTIQAYPGIEKLHPHQQSTRLSWVFNRGSGISATSSRDLEKRALRADTPDHPERFPAHYRSSKRIWVGKGLDGLLRRREDEARLDEKALAIRR